jgi:hypothetical protein
MEMDLQDQKYDRSLYERYIYGSAEVVGLMCLRVFCKGDECKGFSLCKKPKSTRIFDIFRPGLVNQPEVQFVKTMGISAPSPDSREENTMQKLIALLIAAAFAVTAFAADAPKKEEKKAEKPAAAASAAKK